MYCVTFCVILFKKKSFDIKDTKMSCVNEGGQVHDGDDLTSNYKSKSK